MTPLNAHYSRVFDGSALVPYLPDPVEGITHETKFIAEPVVIDMIRQLVTAEAWFTHQPTEIIDVQIPLHVWTGWPRLVERNPVTVYNQPTGEQK